jgi:hypothetical protein
LRKRYYKTTSIRIERLFNFKIRKNPVDVEEAIEVFSFIYLSLKISQLIEPDDQKTVSRNTKNSLGLGKDDWE